MGVKNLFEKQASSIHGDHCNHELMVLPSAPACERTSLPSRDADRQRQRLIEWATPHPACQEEGGQGYWNCEIRCSCSTNAAIQLPSDDWWASSYVQFSKTLTPFSTSFAMKRRRHFWRRCAGARAYTICYLQESNARIPPVKQATWTQPDGKKREVAVKCIQSTPDSFSRPLGLYSRSPDYRKLGQGQAVRRAR